MRVWRLVVKNISLKFRIVIETLYSEEGGTDDLGKLVKNGWIAVIWLEKESASRDGEAGFVR